MNSIETLGVAALGALVGERVVQRTALLEKFHVPGSVVGGFLLALFASMHGTAVSWDTTFQTPLMVAFFASVGWGASWRVLLHGGRKMIEFFFITVAAMLAQAALGVVLARAMGRPALLGMITGPAALAGGPGTTLAFAPLFEKAGLAGAQEAGLICALSGILVGGVLGPVLGTWIYSLKSSSTGRARHQQSSHFKGYEEEQISRPIPASNSQRRATTYFLWLVSMGLGSLLMAQVAHWGLTLPVYFGAMVSGMLGRVFFEKQVDLEEMDSVAGSVLSLFVTMAIMTLNLKEISGMAGVLLLIFSIQAVLTWVLSVGVGLLWAGGGREGAFFGAGFFGFMMGTTANALSNMHGLARKLGPSRRPFLIVPLVGACFVDFVNAALLTFSLKFFGN